MHPPPAGLVRYQGVQGLTMRGWQGLSSAGSGHPPPYLDVLLAPPLPRACAPTPHLLILLSQSLHALEDPELYGIDDSPEELAAVLADANREVCNLAALRERLAGHVVPLVGVTAHPVTGHPQLIVMKLVDTTLDKHVALAKPWLHSLWRLLCDVCWTSM
jgi:hypothetical protein